MTTTLNDFTQLFNPVNWTSTLNGGSVTYSSTASITIVCPTTINKTTFAIKIPINGIISFNYTTTTIGLLSNVPFGYGIDESEFFQSTATGSITTPAMNANTVFSFKAKNLLNSTTTSTTTITNFKFIYSYPACFNEGTKILCLTPNQVEDYIPIEQLRSGDIVKSYKHGYRKIDLIGKKKMVNNPNVFIDCMYKLEKTPTNGLTEDLMLTGGHSILVDNYKDKNINKDVFGECQTIDDKCLLLVGTIKEFIKQENNDEYTYYHFILENDNDDSQRFGVWANGILTDTPSKTEFIDHNYELL